MISGVYAIKSQDGRIYVGQSTDMIKRLSEHLGLLIRGSHNNRSLQNTFIKHGLNGITWTILEQCKKECLDDAEKMHVLTLRKSDHNVSMLKPVSINPAIMREARREKALRDEFSIWLRGRRATLQLDQLDVAIRAGVSRFTVSRIERGHRTHPLVAAAIRRALNKDQSDAS